MDAADFTDRAPGRLIRNLQGELTFVAHPLPPEITWSNKTVTAQAEAEAALGRLAGLGQRFPNPRRLVRLFLRREAELSSRIENTYAGVRTQLLFPYVPEVRENAPDAKEVDNNFKALEFGLRAIRNRPLS